MAGNLRIYVAFVRKVTVWPYSNCIVCSEIISQHFWRINALVWILSTLWFIIHDVAVFDSIHVVWWFLVVVLARSLYFWQYSNFVFEEFWFRFPPFILTSMHLNLNFKNRDILINNLLFAAVCEKSSPKDYLQIKPKIINNTLYLQISRKWNHCRSTWLSYSPTQNLKSRLYCEPKSTSYLGHQVRRLVLEVCEPWERITY